MQKEMICKNKLKICCLKLLNKSLKHHVNFLKKMKNKKHQSLL